MTPLAEIERDARTALAPFRDPSCKAAWPAISRALRPRLDDYALVFAASIVDAARAHFEALWSRAPVIAPGPSQTELFVEARWSQQVSMAGSMPGGYRRIAELLVPDRAWVRFRFCEPDKRRGLMFDGLVPAEDRRWAWFPKPWKVVPRTNPFSYWVD